MCDPSHILPPFPLFCISCNGALCFDCSVRDQLQICTSCFNLQSVKPNCEQCKKLVSTQYCHACKKHFCESCVQVHKFCFILFNEDCTYCRKYVNKMLYVKFHIHQSDRPRIHCNFCQQDFSREDYLCNKHTLKCKAFYICKGCSYLVERRGHEKYKCPILGCSNLYGCHRCGTVEEGVGTACFDHLSVDDCAMCKKKYVLLGNGICKFKRVCKDSFSLCRECFEKTKIFIDCLLLTPLHMTPVCLEKVVLEVFKKGTALNYPRNFD